VAKAGRQRSGLAEVAAEPDNPDVRRAAVETRERRERAVGGAVVDEHGFPWAFERVEGAGELVVEQLDASILVVDGDDDRDHGSSLCAR
jgi:hypothetical protein